MRAATSLISRASQARGLKAFFSPRQRLDPSDDQLVHPPAEPVLPEAARGKQVLIVDDDPIMLKTASLKLESKGFKVSTATDGAGAIQTARQGQPDLILLDLNFPPGVAGVPWTGHLIMSWLRRMSESKDIPVIIVTGKGYPQDKERSLAAGALGFFEKPVDYNSLLAAVGQGVCAKVPAKANAEFQI